MPHSTCASKKTNRKTNHAFFWGGNGVIGAIFWSLGCVWVFVHFCMIDYSCNMLFEKFLLSNVHSTEKHVARIIYDAKVHKHTNAAQWPKNGTIFESGSCVSSEFSPRGENSESAVTSGENFFPGLIRGPIFWPLGCVCVSVHF